MKLFPLQEFSSAQSNNKGKGKGKTIHAQSLRFHEFSRNLRLSDLKTTVHESGNVVTSKQQTPLYFRNCS
jgi:hypothetical protein